MNWRQRVTNLSRRGGKMAAIAAIFVGIYSIFTVLTKGRISNLYDHDLSTTSQFPAIYNFGDSNSDTGACSAVFSALESPYGMTYFHKPAGRYSDGRLIIDFIAEKLGLPYLSAYVDSIGTNFRHGANFAASGATIQPADATMLNNSYSSISLDIQLSQFEQFKTRSYDLYLEEKSTEMKNRLPRSEDYTRALYTIDIGQNDLDAGVKSMKAEQVKKFIPNIINQLSSVVEKLYKGGARTFWIHNTGPLGCLPNFFKNHPPTQHYVDEIGCVKSYNELAQEFNKQLKDKISKLATQLQESSLVYVDIYSLKYSLISEANNYGFIDPLGKCLWKDENVYKVCVDPLKYINWDGIHYTEAANKWVANHLQDEFINATGIL